MATEKSKQQNKDRKNCKTRFREVSKASIAVERVFPDGTSGIFRIKRSDLNKFPTKILEYCVLATALEIISNNKDQETHEPLTAENFQERFSKFHELDISKFLDKYRCKQKRFAENKAKEELKAKIYELDAKIHELDARLRLPLPSISTH